MLSLKVAVLCILAVGMVTAGAARAANPILAMETSMGTIKIELYEEKAPLTVKNFLGYVDAKHYDGTVSHRVIGKENSPEGRDFMIQGGGFDKEMTEKKTRAAIKNESGNGLSNIRGTIAMARLPDPDTATAQFFINVADNTFLDDKGGKNQGYTVFGRVVEGMDVVDKIKAVKTGTKGRMGNVPLEPVEIKSVKRVEEKK
jgi:cyclophilin family peptidyl-prolyl cis-trans isomerase